MDRGSDGVSGSLDVVLDVCDYTHWTLDWSGICEQRSHEGLGLCVLHLSLFLNDDCVVGHMDPFREGEGPEGIHMFSNHVSEVESKSN